MTDESVGDQHENVCRWLGVLSTIESVSTMPDQCGCDLRHPADTAHAIDRGCVQVVEADRDSSDHATANEHDRGREQGDQLAENRRRGVGALPTPVSMIIAVMRR